MRNYKMINYLDADGMEKRKEEVRALKKDIEVQLHLLEQCGNPNPITEEGETIQEMVQKLFADYDFSISLKEAHILWLTYGVYNRNAVFPKRGSKKERAVLFVKLYLLHKDIIQTTDDIRETELCISNLLDNYRASRREALK